MRIRRSPSWGAWIEIATRHMGIKSSPCRSPSWGAWIEIPFSLGRYHSSAVAPPRGERGLKFRHLSSDLMGKKSLPLVGSVD